MKTLLLLINSCIVAALMLPITTHAETPQAEVAENANTEECSVNLLQPPQLTPTGEVLFLSGGTCSDSVKQIKNLAKSFSLEVVLVERTDEYDKESYIANVATRISNKNGDIVLDVLTEGPYLLVDLADGEYLITATYNNVVKTRQVTVDKSKHSRVVLLWDNRSPGEPDHEE